MNESAIKLLIMKDYGEKYVQSLEFFFFQYYYLGEVS